jgi:hypothetical protein
VLAGCVTFVVTCDAGEGGNQANYYFRKAVQEPKSSQPALVSAMSCWFVTLLHFLLVGCVTFCHN